MPTGFNIDEQAREIDGIVAQTLSPTGSKGSHITNHMELAKAWMARDEQAWARDNTHLMRTHYLPNDLIRLGKPPFPLGFCWSETPDDAGLMGLNPPFLSPGRNIAQTGVVNLVPAFGRMGGHRYTNLHEAGHFISNAMNLHDDTDEALRSHRSECLADGFSIAWAVATGADPVASVQQVAGHRAVAGIHHDYVSGAYHTFPVLPAAAMVGMRHRGAPHPVGIMEDLDREVRRHALAPDIVKGTTPTVSLKDLGDKHPTLLAQIQGAANHHVSWSPKQDAQWMQAVIDHNPTHAPTLSRAPFAIEIAKMTHPHLLKILHKGSAPRVGQLLTSHTAQLAAGPDRAAALAALAPTDMSQAAQAEALNKASQIFSRDDELRIRHGLMSLAITAEHCCKPVSSIPPPISGHETPTSPRSFLLLDARGRNTQEDPLHELVLGMRGQPITAIGVVHDDMEQAHQEGRKIRAMSNTFSATIHAMDPERLAEKLPDIQQQVQSGRVWVVGDLPELPQKTPRRQERERD